MANFVISLCTSELGAWLFQQVMKMHTQNRFISIITRFVYLHTSIWLLRTIFTANTASLPSYSFTTASNSSITWH